MAAGKAILALSLADDERGEHERVEATAEHPFWAEGQGWVGAGSLQVGQRVLRADGQWLRVEKVEARAGRQTVYNLEVEDYHTYIVGRLGAWVHNTCPEFVFRQLSAADRAALDAGGALIPKGVGGTLAEHVAGIETGHISASLLTSARIG